MSHITGKVYDMTQENFKKLIDELALIKRIDERYLQCVFYYNTFKDSKIVDKKQSILNNVSDLMVFADQLLMMEEDQDRLNGSNMKESLDGIKYIIEESLL